ncbi:MAG: HD domain-containing protein, partial [Thermoanaerobaculia bacterium]|nr:HD domain-containing protein [Thermoanaerobaculia bacterium]
MPVVRNNEPIASWQDGDFAQGFALVARKDTREDKRGRDYVDMELADGSGAIVAKIWPDSPAMKGTFDEKDFVAFKGQVKSFRDQLQLSVDHIRRVRASDAADGFDPDELIPTAAEGIEPLWQRLTDVLQSAVGRPVLKRLVDVTLSRYGDRLKIHPAAKSIHHAFRGGLLQHLVYMSELALSVCRQYPEVDRDLVLLGILFHDLGKLDELGPMPENDYTIEGQLVGHIVLGQNMLRDSCDAVANEGEAVPDRIRLHLEHLVLSHHGKREFGSPVEPATPEAWVLHVIDLLDSKMNHLRSAHNAEGDGLHYLHRTNMRVFFDPELETAAGTDSDS